MQPSLDDYDDNGQLDILATITGMDAATKLRTSDDFADFAAEIIRLCPEEFHLLSQTQPPTE